MMRASIRSVAASIKRRVGVSTLADDVFDAGERAEPVSGVRQLRPCHAGKEILRATSKACDFVRHRCAKHEHGVVDSRSEQFVETDGNGVIDQVRR